MNIKNIYYVITSSRSFIIQMVFTLNAIYYVSQAELNPLQLVLVGTIMELSILLFEMPTGLVADFFGRKKSLVVGTFIIGAAHLLEGSFPEFWAIAVGAALWGIGWTFISGAEQAWIADELENKQLEQVFLKGAQYSSIGRFIGIIVSMLSAFLFSVQATILIAGGMLVLLAVIAFMIMPETKYITASREDMSGLGQMVLAIKGGVSQIKGNSVLVGIAVVTLFWGLASEGFDRLWGAHFIEGFNLAEEDSVYWFGAFYAVAFLLNIAVLKVVEVYVKGRYAYVLLWMNGLLSIAMLLFAFIGNFYIAILLYWLITSLRNVNYPLMSVLTNERLQSQGRATALSMFGQLDALGQVAGGPLVGIIALYTSINGGIVASAILIIPTLYLLWRMRKLA
ncbi:MFS transporter [Bacillus sp. AGMB 02131]|uniref:MFS transporter n=1 Tax=Peribacillus faecalis TaxID=2772559 RepID=A0A927HB06_9BACI|nr:MFS transporter [Peribacillus faecalis]MBD3109250.1 MFS transporter [Peribacillus faecalis]